jgi:hypothetical protein
VVSKLGKKCRRGNKQQQKTDVERFNLTKLNEIEVSKQFQIKVSNRFAALENSNDSEDINMGWENIKENIRISAKDTIGLYGRKQHKPWSDKECSQFLGQRKQAKMQWLQDPNQSNLDNVNNARHKTSRHFRNKKREYLKAKIN